MFYTLSGGYVSLCLVLLLWGNFIFMIEHVKTIKSLDMYFIINQKNLKIICFLI